ncbi:MAG: hypothetical protein JWO32_730 [Bacteroidetes bacterium]|nr:hypothetical protein [Bacteroidota bacterium]
MNTTTIKILKEIINKGGLMGYVAKMYLNDESLAHQFILECAQQCHNKQAIDFWGTELTQKIIKHSKTEITKLYLLNEDLTI